MTTTGQQLGSYVLGDPIGRSGLAMVYRGEHASTGRPVILKVIQRYFAADSEVLQAFLKELIAVRDLRHPNIVSLEDFGLDGATAWLALERVDGTTLKEATPPPYTPEVVCEIATQLAEALEYAHQRGVLHRNLKPNNVFLTGAGAVKLSDFAMATLGAGVHPLMRTGLTTPMPAFVSPEQAEGVALTPRSDVYSLGILTYWMLTGRVPFPGDTAETVLARQMHAAPLAPSHLAPHLSREIDAVVLKALSPFLPARYGAPTEFAASLRQAVGVTVPLALTGAFSAHGAGLGSSGAAGELAQPSEAAEPSQVELAFRRIWRPTIVDRRKVIRSLALVGIATAVIVGWAWWANFAPEPYLPPPTSNLSVEAPPGTWPVFRRDVRRTGADPDSNPTFRGEVRWSFSTQEPILASPVAMDGLVFLPTGERRIVALDAATGDLRWQVPTTGPVDSTPAVAGDSLYVGLRDGRLLCLDRRSGALRWEFDTRNPILSSPLVAGGTVFFGSGDSRIYAVDAATGELRWSFETAGWVTSSPAIWEDLVIVGSRDGWVYFLDVNNGARKFYFHTGGAVEASPTVADGRVYIGNEQRRFWVFRTSERSTPWDRRIYAIHAQLFIWGLSPPPPTPKGVVWVRRAPKRFVGSAAVGPAGVFVGNEDGKLYAWTPDGAERWQFKAGGPILSSPALVGSTLYVGADDDKFYALDAETGQQRWAFTADGKVRNSPAVTADSIYVGTSNGTLYALR